jgi:LmbE family N-acetylglucosaminyl deacetylase
VARTVVHLSPHPDDELIGAPATLMALRDAGYRIVNVACSLGGVRQSSRRKAELTEACTRAGFELVVPPGVETRLSGRGSVTLAHAELVELTREMIGALQPDLVLSPSPHDRHPYHETVGRAVRDALADRPCVRPRWWMWAVWGNLPFPTIGTIFGPARVDELVDALAAHAEELERNDYRQLVTGRARMNVSLGAELLFGFGSTSPSADYVELVTEVVPAADRWLLGRPRWLGEGALFAEPTKTDVREWLFSASLTERFGQPGMTEGRSGEGVRRLFRRQPGISRR